MSAGIKEQYCGGLCGDDLHSFNDRGDDMGMLVMLIIFVVTIIPLCALLEWRIRTSRKIERRVKRLEVAIFDGPGGGK